MCLVLVEWKGEGYIGHFICRRVITVKLKEEILV